jgi:hypothetical protein
MAMSIATYADWMSSSSSVSSLHKEVYRTERRGYTDSESGQSFDDFHRNLGIRDFVVTHKRSPAAILRRKLKKQRNLPFHKKGFSPFVSRKMIPARSLRKKWFQTVGKTETWTSFKKRTYNPSYLSVFAENLPLSDVVKGALERIYTGPCIPVPRTQKRDCKVQIPYALTSQAPEVWKPIHGKGRKVWYDETHSYFSFLGGRSVPLSRVTNLSLRKTKNTRFSSGSAEYSALAC